MRFLAGIVLAALVATSPAAAHPAPFSYVDVDARGSGVKLPLVVHVFDVAQELQLPDPERRLEPGAVSPERIVRLLRDRLQLELDDVRLPPAWSSPVPIPERQSLRLQARYEGRTRAGRLALTASMFPYDPQHQTFVNFYEDGTLRSQAILSRTRERVEYFSGTRQGAFAVLRRFIPAGFHHILIGPDHLLFLFGLLLLGGPLRRLALVVTAFTAAHSVTLTLAALDLFAPPPSLVEPAIALSIVYVGADNLLVRGGRDVRVWIAFGFGLIHGFGFAGVLREMALPASRLAWSLFSFNLGIELGQLLVVVPVGAGIAWLRRRSEATSRRLAVGGSLAVMAAGAFWFVQRVFLSGGVA